jgi:hypothetical protein
MGRKQAQLAEGSVADALEYIQGALARRDHISFRSSLAAAGRAHAELLERLGAESAQRAQIADEWIRANLSDKGREKMLAALRRRRAHAIHKGAPTSKTMRVRATTRSALQELARKLDMPVALALECAIEVVLADEKAQRKVIALGVAIKTKTGRRPSRSVQPERGSKDDAWF